jgi:hypothetical protein
VIRRLQGGVALLAPDFSLRTPARPIHQWGRWRGSSEDSRHDRTDAQAGPRLALPVVGPFDGAWPGGCAGWGDMGVDLRPRKSGERDE